MAIVQICISCMFKDGHEIIKETKVQTDVIVVNQCNDNSTENFTFSNSNGRLCKGCIVNTTERGLSRSRNMAIDNSWGDYLLFCDDDEVLVNGYEGVIYESFFANKKADIIAFDVRNYDSHIFSTGNREFRFKDIWTTKSVQISVKRNAIVKNRIQFDVTMGSGTGNGGGEENKFLMDCRRKKLGMFSVDVVIANLKESDSIWNHGYSDSYFENLGWVNRRIAGLCGGYMYIWFFAIKHYSQYKSKYSMVSVIRLMHRGFFSNR